MKLLRSPITSLPKAHNTRLAKINKQLSPATALPRREFFRIGGITAAATLGLPSLLKVPSAQAIDAVSGSSQRRNRAYQIRQQAAMLQMQQASPAHPNNGDEAAYPNKIGNFSKGLPHNDLGEVDLKAYGAFIQAVNSGNPADFEAIPMGCPDVTRRSKLTNPQAGLAFDLEGADSHALAIAPAPGFSTAQEASEIVENYWMALARDIPFSEYDNYPLTQLAAADLSSMSDFRGPRIGNQVTIGALFRGLTSGDLIGPYISQFMWLPTPFGADFVDNRMRTKIPGLDYMTNYDEWLNIQRGFPPSNTGQFDSTRRYIRNGRDLAQWVHIDVLYQAYFQAMLILMTPPSTDVLSGGIGAPFDAGNPYGASETQAGFGTFGGPHIASLLTEVATRALKAVWFEKWFVHRRLRPEAFAGRIHNHVTSATSYPISADALNSAVLSAIYSKYGAYLLPMAFSEGCPLHPAYGAGHATVAGACVTILKAWFDESFIIPNPVQATADGLALIAYTGPALSVGGELNKLAANVAIGRNIAGVHWRSDATESLKLGEAVAISVLRDHRGCYNEEFAGFTFTKFDGTTVTV